MNLDRIGIDCPLYEFDCSDIEFDIGEFYALSPNNGKLTLAHNGVSIGDFTANQQEDETINIVTPTSEDITNAVAGEALLRQQADNTLQSNINAEQLARERADRDIQSVLDGESLARSNADNELQRQIDAIASKSDVVDVVANYAALQVYDTSKLNDNDVVKVLDDETHGDTMTYYRWNKSTSSWSYIGQEAAYYSKSQMDTLLATKQDNLTAGTGIDITGATISADTTVLATKSELSSYAEKSNTYTKTEVDNLVEPKLSVEVVENLPVTGEENKLYLTEKAKTIQTATGNPITATITDGAGNLSDFRLDGDTYQQSYTGKNQFNINSTPVSNNLNERGITYTINPDGSISTSGTNNASYAFMRFDFSLTAGTYTVSGCPSGGSNEGYSITVIYTDSGTQHQIYDTGNGVTFTLSATTTIRLYPVRIGTSTVSLDNKVFKPMLESGSTATSYEPYVGGIPAPNPDYPQAIQTVTGEQTVTINSTDYPIDLGSIELCKLGTYQDYIYKDGNDWKVHKAIGSFVFDGSDDEGWFRSGSSTNTMFVGAINIQPLGIYIQPGSGIVPLSETNYFTASSAVEIGSFWIYNTSGGYMQNMRLCIAGTSQSTVSDLKNFLSNHNTELNYVLATATDTVITDSALISQLEAIRTARLENGSNTLSNSATGSNLAGDMEISYYGYSPTNRYDKWLWLDINNSYEQLGS